jgi:hypothetical protein
VVASVKMLMGRQYYRPGEPSKTQSLSLTQISTVPVPVEGSKSGP